MFMDELIRRLDHSKPKAAQVLAFKCMQQNLAQLSENLGLNEKEFIDECHRISDLFSNAAADKNDHTDLLLLNKQLHELIRARMNKEKAVNGISQKQAFNLIISLIYMLIVTSCFNF